MDYQPNRNEQVTPEEDALDIKKYLFMMLTNWYWFALSLFICLFVSYLVNRYSENVYKVQSSLLIRDDESPNSFTGAENLIQGLKLVRNTKSVQNEIGILKSYSLAYKTISELKDFKITYVGIGRRGIVKNELYTRSPIVVILDTTANNIAGYPVYVTILSEDKYLLEIDNQFNIKKEIRWGEPFRSNSFNFTIVLKNSKSILNFPSGSKFYFVINTNNSMANAYKGKLSVELNDKKGSILILSTLGAVPEKEADFQNKLMQTYIQKGLDEKNRIAENTIRFIDSQLSNMIDSLSGAEKRLQDFRSNNKVIDISKEGSIIYDNIQKLQNEKGIAELKKRYYNYLKKYLVEKKELKDIVAPSAMGVDDTQLSSILEQVSDAYIEQEALMLSARSSTPGMNLFTSKLETLKKTLEEKVNSLIEVNSVTLSEVNRQTDIIEREMIKIPYTQRLLIGFEREFNLINKMYNYLNEKRAEASIAKASNIPDNKVLDYALPENASFVKPNRKKINIYGFMMGIMIPFAIIITIGYFNTAISNIKEIHSHTSAPILGVIGHNSYETELPVALNPKSTLAESFRGLRTNLKYILREPDQKVIMITSTISEEGKTFVAANLALIIALTGKKVLLVGLDLRKPKMNGILGVPYQNGMSTYLIGRDEFNSIVYPTAYDNLYFSPSGPVPPNPAELIGISRMDDYIVEAKKQFDYIIVDTPPAAMVTDTLIASRFSDALLFITRFNYTSRESLNLVENLRARDDSKNIVIVVNDVIHRRKYGYSYGYGFPLAGKYGHRNSDYYSDDKHPLTFKDKVLRFFG